MLYNPDARTGPEAATAATAGVILVFSIQYHVLAEGQGREQRFGQEPRELLKEALQHGPVLHDAIT